MQPTEGNSAKLIAAQRVIAGVTHVSAVVVIVVIYHKGGIITFRITMHLDFAFTGKGKTGSSRFSFCGSTVLLVCKPVKLP